MGSNYTQQIIYRDAITGRIVSKDYALKNPNTTVKEVRKIPKK
ncbi:hypothetical protein [Elizabethkingia anophelis]|nr:hypothetical protein [Elizabethkingia anophelis]